jgi:hypothetical protein
MYTVFYFETDAAAEEDDAKTTVGGMTLLSSLELYGDTTDHEPK